MPEVEPPQIHLNGQLPLIKADPSHGTKGQTRALSGTGNVAQLNLSQRAPEKPAPHWQAHVAALKVNPLAQAKGVHEVTAVVLAAAAVEPPQRHLNGQLPLTTAEPSHGIRGHT